MGFQNHPHPCLFLMIHVHKVADQGDDGVSPLPRCLSHPSGWVLMDELLTLWVCIERELPSPSKAQC